MRELTTSELNACSGGLTFTVGTYQVSMGNNGPGGSLACTMISQGIGGTAGIMTLSPGVYRITSLGVNIVCNFATQNITITKATGEQEEHQMDDATIDEYSKMITRMSAY